MHEALPRQPESSNAEMGVGEGVPIGVAWIVKKGFRGKEAVEREGAAAPDAAVDGGGGEVRGCKGRAGGAVRRAD
jgi:hypothetical protein